MPSADILICGAGIAGVSAAYHLAVRHGRHDILIVDELPPLSLTSDKSTECYRNWWPGPGEAMVALMNRSIDLLERLADESGNVFHLNRRGYLYVTGDQASLLEFRRKTAEPASLGAGALRIHTGRPGEAPYRPTLDDNYRGQPEGADLILESGLLHKHFPYLARQALAGLHVRRAGWFSAQQLGAYLLEKARACGVRLIGGRVAGVETRTGCIEAVVLQDGERVTVHNFVNAAGPLLQTVARMLDLDLPVYNEVHLKVAFKDYLGILPRNAPLLIWDDPQRLPWSEDERAALAEDPSAAWLLGEFPPGVHTRPEGPTGSPIILMLWDYHNQVIEPVWPPPLDQDYPEIALRGLATMLPGLRVYFDKSLRPSLDGGYYTRTRENRPLIGPLPVEGAFVIGALSGYGLMASLAAGELLAAHLTGNSLPDYAPAFSLERYQDPAYQQLLENWGDPGQI
ncbi:MAG TPA: FAD-binding oxidoreductase [Anaerolineales bacterium]|nr:FAD-binding oxidoreductase [Anaerolineales bacterium]